MEKLERVKRIKAEKIADAINNIEGVPVSDRAKKYLLFGLLVIFPPQI